MAFDAFLKLGDIKGESQVKGFEDQIQIESFHWGVATTVSSGGGGGGGSLPTKQDFLFTADSSKASPELFIACATGEHIKEGLLTLRHAGGDQTTLSTIKLSDVVVTVYDQAGNAEADRPMDEFALHYNKIDFNYDGVKAIYDFVKGTKG